MRLTDTDAGQTEHAGVEQHLTHFFVKDSEEEESGRDCHGDYLSRYAFSSGYRSFRGNASRVLVHHTVTTFVASSIEATMSVILPTDPTARWSRIPK